MSFGFDADSVRDNVTFGGGEHEHALDGVTDDDLEEAIEVVVQSNLDSLGSMWDQICSEVADVARQRKGLEVLP